MSWRKAKSLDALLHQINTRWPDRDKKSDGSIGDEKHRARKSDHNPNSAGVVCAIDITHDSKCGCDMNAIAAALLASRDPRINYIIFNKRIAFAKGGQGLMPWTLGPYSKAKTMPHDKHLHLSVHQNAVFYDNNQQWHLSSIGGTLPLKPAEVVPPDLAKVERQRMGKLIIGYEKPPTKDGRITVYTADDGSKEIAGVNNAHHPEEYERLHKMLTAGDHAGVERGVIDYLLTYTQVAAAWAKKHDLAIEFYLRDCCFNRGPKGAARILQRAVGVPDDGAVGPATMAATIKHTSKELLPLLRGGRESYERDVLKRVPGSPKWNGMVNRWNKSLEDATTFHSKVAPPEVIAGGGAVVVGGGGAVIAASQGADWITIGLIVLGAALIGAVIIALVRKHRDD